jgi:Lon protease-like protein
MAELPNVIPLFPLPNLVLFPRIQVPLHIFEPRYREMIADIAETHRTIGMMLLKGNTYPDIFEVGCAGRIETLDKLPDGRFNLILAGTCEFKILREIRERSYRQAEVKWCPLELTALQLDSYQLGELRRLLLACYGESARQAWTALVERQGLKDTELVNFFCFHLDLNSLEKQTLLQAAEQRFDCLIDILQFKLEERKSGPDGPGSGSVPVQ